MISTEQLILYVDPKWRKREVHSPLMNPWWGNPFAEESIFPKQMFDSYAFDTSCYTITDKIDKADIVFVPYRHSWLLRFDKELLIDCQNTARAHNLPLLLDGATDIECPINLSNTYILRYGGYRFLPESGKIQIPLCVDDLLVRCRNNQLEIRKKSESKPIIGFAGWSKISPQQYLRTIIKELPVRLRSIFDSRYHTCIKGVLWRQKIIKILQRSSLVTLDLLARESFSANQKTAQDDIYKLQEEMVNTILHSDYALDVRGDANNSARLFEILSLGRIPVIIDTERNFPFSDKIDYSSFALIVDFRDIDRLPELISDFHKNISPERFEQMQRNAREAFVKFFRIDAMMRHVVREVRERMEQK